MITNKNTCLPDSIGGLYEVDIMRLKLRPVLVPNEPPSECYLTEIFFEHGLGIAVFSNGEEMILNVIFDEKDFTYSFDYNRTRYVFQIRASLGGISKLVDINVEYDFNRLE